MKIKFKVFACGEHSFHSKKADRDIQLARLMGVAYDAVGSEVPAIADLGFNGSLGVQPVSGQDYLLEISRFETENAMAKFTFDSIEPFSAKGK